MISGLGKNLNNILQLFFRQASHVLLTQGYFLLILVHEFIREWLAWIIAHFASELSKLLAQWKKSTCPRLPDATFFSSPEYFFLINSADYFMKEMGPFSEIFANLESMNRAVSNALVESAKVYILLFIFLITYNVRVLDVGFI